MGVYDVVVYYLFEKLETGNWKLETGNWKLETGNWKMKNETSIIIYFYL
jgi:hypothetical protein